MKIVEPKVFHVAQTTLDRTGMDAYLAALGVPDWVTDAPSDSEALIEVMGRGCYRSFAPGLNKNVTKVREGSLSYLKNILTTKHGSVLEHAGDSYVFLHVSRVFTHELVRNRVGNGFSQESLRYVRLDDLNCWFPNAFANHAKSDKIMEIWTRVFNTCEGAQVELSQLLEVDAQPMNIKKKLTSAMRRLAPIGLATMIGYTGNHRSIRWAIEQRTHWTAEEEIRMVFAKVFHMQKERYPNLYSDAVVTIEDGLEQIAFENSHV